MKYSRLRNRLPLFCARKDSRHGPCRSSWQALYPPLVCKLIITVGIHNGETLKSCKSQPFLRSCSSYFEYIRSISTTTPSTRLLNELIWLRSKLMNKASCFPFTVTLDEFKNINLSVDAAASNRWPRSKKYQSPFYTFLLLVQKGELRKVNFAMY